HRDAPVLVVVDAHAQVHLGGAGVGVVGLGQAQDRIARDQFNVRKEGHGGSRRRRRGGAPRAAAKNRLILAAISTPAAFVAAGTFPTSPRLRLHPIPVGAASAATDVSAYRAFAATRPRRRELRRPGDGAADMGIAVGPGFPWVAAEAAPTGAVGRG